MRGGRYDDEPVVSPQRLGICCIAASGLTLMVLLLSMAVVHPVELGLVYNRFSSRVSNDVKEPGRYFIGPQSFMLLYPSVVQNLEFSDRPGADVLQLETRTEDGLQLFVHLSFQYKLRADSLYNLYTKFPGGHKDAFERFSGAELLKIAGTYGAREYWEKRPIIAVTMLEAARRALSEWADVTDFQLLRSDLPQAFEDSVIATQVQKQIEKTREAEKDATYQRALISVMLTRYLTQRQILLNEATANAALLVKNAQAQAQKERIDVEKTALARVDQAMQFTPSGKTQYQKGIAYQTLGDAQFMFGVSQTAILSKQGGQTLLQAHESSTECKADMHKESLSEVVKRAAQMSIPGR